jgi:hypothetical protein
MIKHFVNSEYVEQVQFVKWLSLKHSNVLFSSSAGGMRTSIGTACKMKSMGYRKGCPDIMIFEPNTQYRGLFIELKKEKGGQVTPEQKQWIELLNQRGYFAMVCKGAEEAKKVVEMYFLDKNG